MSRSKIKGSINGAAFASMSKLATLAISNNPKLEGRVPAEVLDLPSLTHLDVSSNPGLKGLDQLQASSTRSRPQLRLVV